MKTIKITLTDAEYCELMGKVNAIHWACAMITPKPLTKAKTLLGMCAKLNLQRNVEMFARAFNGCGKTV